MTLILNPENFNSILFRGLPFDADGRVDTTETRLLSLDSLAGSI